MAITERWTSTLETLKSQGRYRSLRSSLGIDFTSNDYLGYGSSRSRIRPVGDLERNRSGMASRLLRGHHPIWDEVESALAAWHHAESILMMTSGYAANEGLISTIIEPGDWVASDELNHACIVDGLRMARARRFSFRHNDLNHLEEGLKAEHQKRHEGRELFIITESLFSMDGDRAPLREIVELAERYSAYLIVDEAHATGCFGVKGSGIVDELGLRDRILASVHTGGKALGVLGAYIACSALLREFLVNRCRHLIFTTALPAVAGAWWLQMLEQVQEDHEGRAKLRENFAFVRNSLTESNLVCSGDQFIIPVILGEDPKAVAVAQHLQNRGFDVRAIRPPSVPPGTARLRISIHADHTKKQLQDLCEALAEGLSLQGIAEERRD